MKPTTKNTTSPFMTASQIAALLPEGRQHVSSVFHWMQTGRLPSQKVGRHRLAKRADVAAFLGLDLAEINR